MKTKKFRSLAVVFTTCNTYISITKQTNKQKKLNFNFIGTQ